MLKKTRLIDLNPNRSVFPTIQVINHLGLSKTYLTQLLRHEADLSL